MFVKTTLFDVLTLYLVLRRRTNVVRTPYMHGKKKVFVTVREEEDFYLLVTSTHTIKQELCSRSEDTTAFLQRASHVLM